MTKCCLVRPAFVKLLAKRAEGLRKRTVCAMSAPENDITLIMYGTASVILLALIVLRYDNCLFPSPPIKDEFKLKPSDTLASLRRTIVDKFGYFEDSFEFAPWGVYDAVEAISSHAQKGVAIRSQRPLRKKLSRSCST